MNTYLKQFGAWVTGSSRNPFQKARIKLTAFYILMLAVILCVFSLTLYFALAKNLREDLDGEIVDESSQVRVINQTVYHLKTTIVIADAGVLLLISFLSYALAGKTMRPIEDALLAQKQFSADASHEFRTPLSIMKSEFEVALENEHISSDDSKVLIKSSLEEINHMSAMVDQLLKLSQSENHNQKLVMSRVNLENIVTAAVQKIHKLAQNKNINLDIDTIGQPWIIGNSGTLQEVVLNLLQNAIDYTPSNGSVAISLKLNAGHQELKIQDSGIGIEPKDLPHIFERFYKADNARTLRSNSSGLGLSIVYDIVEKHHGKIQINSTPKKGTLVTVIFPAVS